MVTCRSSSGCRSDSRQDRLYSGSSSRKSTPLCDRLISPGLGLRPPPISAILLDVWCGDLRGRVVRTSAVSSPAKLCSFVIAITSSLEGAGIIERIARAIIVLQL